jgi:hypothetical protein
MPRYTFEGKTKATPKRRSTQNLWCWVCFWAFSFPFFSPFIVCRRSFCTFWGGNLKRFTSSGITIFTQFKGRIEWIDFCFSWRYHDMIQLRTMPRRSIYCWVMLAVCFHLVCLAFRAEDFVEQKQSDKRSRSKLGWKFITNLWQFLFLRPLSASLNDCFFIHFYDLEFTVSNNAMSY